MRRSELPIHNPCSADWEAMVGDERRRFCRHCRKHVHDLSAVTEREARALLSERSGSDLCVSYASDAEGRILFRPPRRAAGGLPVLAGGALLAACAPQAHDDVAALQANLRADAAVDASIDDDVASDEDGGVTGIPHDAWHSSADADADAFGNPPATTPAFDGQAPCDGKPDTPPHASDSGAAQLDRAPQVTRGRLAAPPIQRTLGEPMVLTGEVELSDADVLDAAVPTSRARRIGKVKPR